MAEKSVPPPPTTRTTRGIKLHRDHAAEIVRSAPHRYRVPSCTGSAIYLVDLRSESCSCPDRPPEGAVCKHVTAALIFRSKAGECVGCRVHRPRRELREAGPDHLVFYEDDLLCKPCARRHGAL
jgi:hypothetical protein